MGNKQVTLLVLFDLSVAFETIAAGFWSRRNCFKLARLISVWSQTTYNCW